MLRRIGIIGCLADGHDMYDGQTISTRVWRKELIGFSQKPLVEVDTFEYRKNLLTLSINLIRCILQCTDIVIMLSGDGLKAILPIMYYSRKLLHKNVYHRVIGGELDRFIDHNLECAKYLNGLNINWVQSPNLVEKLYDRGVTNSAFLENFRRINPITLSPDVYFVDPPFRFCTFCRVSAAKGITEAIHAVQRVNSILGAGTVKLDIYGPIELEYKDQFDELLQYAADVDYKGSVKSEDAVGVLKHYYMHLFPTTWSGEGFPGALIDCYNAALPTIATDWAYNAEYISDGETGYLYDWRDHSLLADKIIYAVQHPDDVFAMRKNCLATAEKYTADAVMGKVKHFMMENSGRLK